MHMPAILQEVKQGTPSMSGGCNSLGKLGLPEIQGPFPQQARTKAQPEAFYTDEMQSPPPRILRPAGSPGLALS